MVDLKARNVIYFWLLSICILLILMILLGGAVRLTNSGLSITEWNVIKGTIPPLTEASWQLAFEKYKQIPEYMQEHAWMSLKDFKFIYGMEWGHRFLGRLIGFLVLFPIFIFVYKRWIDRKLLNRLLLLFLLGALQGGIGWWMVSSGLSERIDVSQYRLAIHLGMAFLILGAVFLTALYFRFPASEIKPKVSLVYIANLLISLLLIQVLLGGIVAGLRAGWSYPTWPLMGDSFVPEGYLSLQPVWRNLFENHGNIQFNHRLLAYLLSTAIILSYFYSRNYLESRQKYWFLSVVILVLIQVMLGISTIFVGPQFWGVALIHQGVAILLFLSLLGYRHSLFYKAHRE